MCSCIYTSKVILHFIYEYPIGAILGSVHLYATEVVVAHF